MKIAKPPLELAPKQLWKMKTGYLRVDDVGKSLVHYRLRVTTQLRDQQVRLIAVEGLKSYLTDNEAVLVPEEILG